MHHHHASEHYFSSTYLVCMHRYKLLTINEMPFVFPRGNRSDKKKKLFHFFRPWGSTDFRLENTSHTQINACHISSRQHRPRGNTVLRHCMCVGIIAAQDTYQVSIIRKKERWSRLYFLFQNPGCVLHKLQYKNDSRTS